MLMVGPGSAMLPICFSVWVLATSTLLLPESKASTVDRSGDIAMRPGELPAAIPPLCSVSISPLMSIRPGGAVGVAALCEARPRVVSPTGPDLPPQAIRLQTAVTSRANKSAALFKRQAPNYRETRDLGAK